MSTRENEAAVRLAACIKAKAAELGFSSCGITSCDDFDDYDAELLSREDYAPWHDDRNGIHGGSYPKQFFPQGQSIICATYGFSDIDYPENLLAHVGRIYLARCYSPLPESEGGQRLTAFQEYLESQGMEVYQSNIFGQVMVPARVACARAGITTFGYNNFARTKEDGSFVVLYVWLVDKWLPRDEPSMENNCPEGCTRCMDACPTHAIVAPGRLHPQNCILLNNIAGAPSPELRPAMGGHFHGCDVCQEVCPKNRRPLSRPKRKDPLLEEIASRFSLEKVLLMDEAYYKEVVRPIMYNYISDLDIFRINAAVALGNSGDASHIPALKQAMAEHPNPKVMEACQWAIERLA